MLVVGAGCADHILAHSRSIGVRWTVLPSERPAVDVVREDIYAFEQEHKCFVHSQRALRASAPPTNSSSATPCSSQRLASWNLRSARCERMPTQERRACFRCADGHRMCDIVRDSLTVGGVWGCYAVYMSRTVICVSDCT